MSESFDDAVQSFSNEVAPASVPRDQQGKVIQNTSRPETIFGFRPTEGDPLTGDTSDGGEDPRFANTERRVANGWTEKGDEGREQQSPANNPPPRVQRAPADDGHEVQVGEPERFLDPDESEQYDSDAEGADAVAETERRDAEGTSVEDAEGGQRYEVTVDGAIHHVTLNEALRGYVRQETFHKRMTQLNGLQSELEQYDNHLRSNWGMWDQARQAYEEDVANMLPKEPNWDEEYRNNPQNAWEMQKIFQTLYGKLAQSRQARADRQAAESAENDRRVQKYAVDGFSRFVMDNKIPDEPTLKKEIQSMRKTALATGFSEQEVATVYDPRMLTILRKASKYDRMMAANRPQPVNPSKGRSIPPGAATPLGNAGRKGLDEAQRRLASSGRLDDATEVFRRMF